ncbi:MAG: Crp/Fnr family transcriptional regulator [Candidatus Devosia phytovorans]|uniref:Crp/Fnr family transcriptional regulator n=1 Tax=Candidatus Devosia phytovorans TaxID=3121372 RepID=A0AAJ5VY77_9HYPH|nr:Crp/Fnr family transcriptional regulator [Devosia sp.]WEK06355.1 MAG: Crp/Fnr family transcriptional regulator [Devosia sp.]
MSIAKYARFASFQSYEAADLRSFELISGPQRVCAKGQFLNHEGQSTPDVYRLRSGWLSCSITTPEGDRQITKIHLPGDLVGMPSMAREVAAETISALTDCVVDVLPLEAFSEIFRKHPRMAGMLFMWSQEERVRLMHQLTLVGRVPSVKRMAAFLLTIVHRVRLSDPEIGDSFVLPLTQQDLGDATGMSVVHANRALRILRERGYASLQKGVFTVHDHAGLTGFAGSPADAKRSTVWI